MKYQKVQEISHRLQQSGLKCLGLLVNGDSVGTNYFKRGHKASSRYGHCWSLEHKGLLCS